MNNVENKPKKPKWFWVVELVISLLFVYFIYAFWAGVAQVFMWLGLSAISSLLIALGLLGGLVHWVILPKWKVGE